MRQAPRSFFLAFLVVASLCPSEGLWAGAKELEEFPLVNRVADKNARTLFSKIPESESGVRFVLGKNSEQKDPLKENPFFVTRRHARGVCAGDFDGDGWDDLFFAHPYWGISNSLAKFLCQIFRPVLRSRQLNQAVTPWA